MGARHPKIGPRTMGLALLCLLGLSASTAMAKSSVRTGLYGRAGAAVGVSQSGRLDQLNAALPGLLIRRGIVPADSQILEARVEPGTLLGASVGLGWRFHPRFAVESSFDWFEARADFTLSFISPSFPGEVLSGTTEAGGVSGWTFMVEAKGYLATGTLQPYGSVGLGVMGESANFTLRSVLPARWSEMDFAPRFGAGLDLALTPRIALNLDAGYVLGTGALSGDGLISLRLGVLARF